MHIQKRRHCTKRGTVAILHPLVLKTVATFANTVKTSVPTPHGRPGATGLLLVKQRRALFEAFASVSLGFLLDDSPRAAFWRHHHAQYLLLLITSEYHEVSARKQLKMLKSTFSAAQLFNKICFRELAQILITSMGNH
ncbi:hypothetical protein Y032_0015g2869 [Ancylostoma ceylanicum]|uniref:Uncharacterized protein n=1 Tax=Ancylostoma ceylanicum TaxID=53326 RepID=A0A016V862_9BILA|nr:hypothetical protein Y032_0015g2869 [Ancylostoma ceylanicum]